MRATIFLDKATACIIRATILQNRCYKETVTPVSYEAGYSAVNLLIFLMILLIQDTNHVNRQSYQNIAKSDRCLHFLKSVNIPENRRYSFTTCLSMRSLTRQSFLSSKKMHDHFMHLMSAN